MIKAKFEPNKALSSSKTNKQHNEIKTKITLAAKTGSLLTLCPHTISLINQCRLASPLPAEHRCDL